MDQDFVGNFNALSELLKQSDECDEVSNSSRPAWLESC
jgi:hypothetical protein